MAPHLAMLLALFAQAAAPAGDVRTYRPLRPASPDTEIHIELPYTLGTHDLVAREIRGTVKMNGDRLDVVSGHLVVPIASLDAGKRTLECHTREALGLDYARSKFPKEHVCDGDVLPPTGSDAVVFPDIAFDWTRTRLLDDASALARGKSVRVEVWGRWTIHGVTRDDRLVLGVTAAAGAPAHPTAFRLTGATKIRLADFGVKVKRALFITAGDEAAVRFNLVIALEGR